MLSNKPDKVNISDIVELPSVVNNVELVGGDENLTNDLTFIVDETVIVVEDENPISSDVTQSMALVRNYFKAYNDKDFGIACDYIADSKCNAKNAGDVNRFGQEFAKMTGGYENLTFSVADTGDFHSDVICVEYDYGYTDDITPSTIHEVMSYYVQEGKITNRVCEEKTTDGDDAGCPILSRRDFCL